MGSVLEKNSAQVRKRIEGHTFDDEEGEEYEGSEFNGFGDYFRRKKIKLQNLDAEMRASSGKPQLFKGIVAHVTGYTQPPLHVLHREIVTHGGGFLQYLDSKTMATHIIASTLPPKKSVDFSRYRIVKPAWIVESIAAGKLLSWTDYRVLDEGPRQKVLRFDSTQGLSQANPKARQGYREDTENSFYMTQLKASPHLNQSWSQAVEKAATPNRQSPRPNVMSPTPFNETPLKNDEATMATETPSKPMPKAEPEPEPPVDHQEPPPDAHGPSTRQAEPPKNATSEEHNAWLLSDPRLRKSSSANPDFLKQFYSESRLHHLSTWKAELKSKMQRLAAEKGPGKELRRKPGSRRYILHVDFDSFFCAVSLKKNPEYVDKPAVVAHGTGTGSEIASCNYPARKFGVKNGMWMKRALELCSDLKVLPYDFPAYEEASRSFYEAILDLGGLVQSVSVDEALVDATGLVLSAVGSQGVGADEANIAREQEKVDEIALTLRSRIKTLTGCEVSVGIGGNILQAKVAMRRAKPAGQYHLKPENVVEVIGELEVERLPGVAYSLGRKLEEAGVKLVKDLRDMSKERLTTILGPKTAEKLRDYAKGIDKVEVGEQPPRKSVSAEVNWGIRFINQPEAEEFVHNLCKELERRLLNEQVKGKQLTMKIMRRSLDAPLDPAKHLGHGKCDTFNKSTTFGVATHSAETIGREAVSILRSYRFSPGDLRGLGVQMTKLEPIKSSHGGPESSQRKLTFGAFTAAPSRRKSSEAEPIDEDDSPRKRTSSNPSAMDLDPIAEDPFTPRKQKIHPAMALARASESDSKAKTPLNVMGTQFIIPSNADAAVIAELPNDIRSRLMRMNAASVGGESASPLPLSRAGGAPSQVDPEVFKELPDEIKAEILASYGQRPPPQESPRPSPRKDRTLEPKKSVTPTKHNAGRGVLGKAQRQKDAQAGLLQTNFRDPRGASETPPPFELAEELDPDFLSELPEDVRREVIADHRRQRLAQRAGLDAPAQRAPRVDPEPMLPGGQHRLQFAPPLPKISFTSGLTSAREIKDMLDSWHQETRTGGPHRGDVEVFEQYLTRVIGEERDLEKARKLVKWLGFLVEQDSKDSKGVRAWKRTLDGVKDVVQRAVKQRGLAPLDL